MHWKRQLSLSLSLSLSISFALALPKCLRYFLSALRGVDVLLQGQVSYSRLAIDVLLPYQVLPLLYLISGTAVHITAAPWYTTWYSTAVYLKNLGLVILSFSTPASKHHRRGKGQSPLTGIGKCRRAKAVRSYQTAKGCHLEST